MLAGVIGYALWNVAEKRVRQMTAPPLARQRVPASSSDPDCCRECDAAGDDRATALMKIREKQQLELEAAAAARAERMKNAPPPEVKQRPAKAAAASAKKPSTYNPLDGSSGGSGYSCSLKSRRSRGGG